MKANQQTREAADLVDVRKNGEGGVTYTCLKCGHVIEANAYYETDYKTMANHAIHCDGQRLVSPPAQALIPVQDIAGLNEYVKQLAGHIKNCVPNGAELDNNEAIALARVSMATDLSPFTGELSYIPKKGPHIGIAGLRRKAKEQSLYSLSPPRAMTTEEKKEHDVRECDVGYMCELFRHDITKEAAEINKLAGEPIITIRPIVGIGIWRRAYKEIAQYKDDPVPHGKSPAWVAKKRAEADALKQAYDIGVNLPYSDVSDDYLKMADAEEADWSVVSDEIIRREAAHNAGRYDDAPVEATASFEDVIATYKDGERELPPWVAELREAIEAHPRASDALGSGNGMIQQLRLSAERMVEGGQFKACVEIVCGHALEEMTFGEAAILMNKFVNGPDFEAKVVGLLS